MLDGILEDCDQSEALDRLVDESYAYLAAIGHVHRYRKQDPDTYGEARKCYCGAWIHPEEYQKLHSHGTPIS
jgi:hypothetical protein